MVRLLTFGARDQEKQNNMLFLIRMPTGAFTFIKSELWLSVVMHIRKYHDTGAEEGPMD